MAIFKNWKPKTVLGKVTKGATIGLGATALVATGVGAVAGAVGGGGLLAGAIAGGSSVVKVAGTVAKTVGTATKTVASKVAAGAVNLVTGNNKEQQAIIKEVKKEAKDAKEKKQFADKLMKLGLSRQEAMSKAGIWEGEELEIVLKDQPGILAKLRSETKSTEKIETGVKKAGSFLIPALLIGGLLMFSGGKKKIF